MTDEDNNMNRGSRCSASKVRVISYLKTHPAVFLFKLSSIDVQILEDFFAAQGHKIPPLVASKACHTSPAQIKHWAPPGCCKEGVSAL